MKNIGKATRFDIDTTLKEIKFLVSNFSSVRKIYFTTRKAQLSDRHYHKILPISKYNFLLVMNLITCKN